MNASPHTLVVLGLLVALPACSSTIQGDDGAGGSDASTTSASVTGSTTPNGAGPTSSSTGGNVEEPPQGLFDCESLELACGSVSFHTYPNPPDAWECIARLAIAGTPGVVLGTWAPGPFYNFTDNLVVYRGDGKAIKQSRHKSCGMPDEPMCPEGGLPWGEPGKVQLCDVVVSTTVEAACTNDEQGCGSMPDDTVTNCVDMPEPTCAEIQAIVAATE